jgi:hypothetical protein
MKSEVEKQIDELKQLGVEVRVMNYKENDKIFVKMPDNCSTTKAHVTLYGRVGDEGRSAPLEMFIKEIKKADD